MSNKLPAAVREVVPADPRARRSVHALGTALVALMHERDFDRITVQDILDRAGVGRATFYAHYRNKQDVLYSSYERMFARLEEALDRPPRGGAPGARLVPVAELLAHVGEVGPFVDALRASGELDAMWALGTDFVARMIERRLETQPGVILSGAKDASPVPPSLVARMLAGALMEMLRWWVERGQPQSPAEMDATFHEMARTALLRPALPRAPHPALQQ